VCLDDELIDGKVKDPKRIKYMKKTFSKILKAIRKGKNVKGVFLWTLVDNFEWEEGYKPRFGLIYNDFKTQKKRLKNRHFGCNHS